MSKAGKRLIEGMKEALAIAKGEQPAAAVTVSGYTYVPKDEVVAELRTVQASTVLICIECIESLKDDSQGLTLDSATIDACATILRNLGAGRSRPTEE